MMGLNIIVCIKSVVLAAPGGKIVRRPGNCALNPFDRPAIEMALRLRDKTGGQVTAMSMGPETAALSLYEAMAMGIDKAVLIRDPALAGSDTLVTSTVLGAALNKLTTDQLTTDQPKTDQPTSFDLVIFGARSADSDTGQVGPQTAALLGLPLVTGVTELEYKNKKFVIKRKMDGFLESYAMILPGVVTIHPAATEPRDAPLGGIQQTFSDSLIQTMSLADLGLEADQVGETGSPTRVLSMRPIKRKRSCDMIEGAPKQQAETLVANLHQSGLIG